MRATHALLLTLFLTLSTLATAAAATASCEQLSLRNASDTALEARVVATMPEVCRVTGTIRPVAGSQIGFELWLPRAGWNGRLAMLGNGGYSSALPLPQMTARAQAGYAVVATDTGHSGDTPDFAVGRPESIVDWGYRAVHLTAVRAKAIVAAYYGKSAHHAYFQGCSTGGHQALMEAQRFPEDFDGIIAGAPGHNRTHLNAGFLWQFVQNHTRDGRQIIPASKLPLIARASVAACRSRNGASAGGLASDPYLSDPLDCDFDPAVLTCKAGDADDCLTAEQVTALKRMYDGARNPRTGERIYFGWPFGSESGWSAYWADPLEPTEPARASFWRIWAFNDPQWDWRRFDFDRDTQRADDALAPVINAMSANLETFRRRGGKLIQYHGMADPVVPFADSIAYHERVASGHRRANEFYRLFLAPGLGHCQGGLGPAPDDVQPVIERWVEKGIAPDRVVATASAGGTTGKGFTRPLCPYPNFARYDGRGAADEAASFTCSKPTRTPKIESPSAEYLR